MAGGNVSCFLCKAVIFYQKDDKIQLTDHLRSEHTADDGIEYLIAGCLMNSDEREAIVNVVKDRDPHFVDPDESISEHDNSNMMIVTEDPVGDVSGGSDLSVSALIPETTLQEVGECSPPSREEKERAVLEFPCPECDQTFNLKIKLNRHLKLHTKKEECFGQADPVTPMLKIIKTEAGVKPKTPRTPRNYIAPPDGEGHACPDCGKRFNAKVAMTRHYEDIHQPGEYPCKGCGRIFTSKNKVSSHYSRNCKNRTY